MSNYNNITARWDRGTLSEAIISRQYDDAATLVAFAGVPTGDDDEDAVYHLIVWMATEEGGEPHEQAPILLDAPEWLISNFYTQFTQVIRFQLCIQTEGGAYEAHSPIFSGRIARSLRHDGTTDDINTSVLFDPYKKYVDEKAMAAGAVVIDAALDANSTNPVQNKIVAGAITELNGRLDNLDVDEAVQDWLDEHPEAVTTVQDGSLTKIKFSDVLKAEAIKDYVTPQMYGYTEGADLGTYLQMAVNAIDSGVVFIPKGTYTMRTGVALKSNVTVMGDYSGETEIYHTTALLDTPLFTSDSSKQNEHIRLLNLSIHSSGARTAFTLLFSNVSYFWFKNCRIGTESGATSNFHGLRLQLVGNFSSTEAQICNNIIVGELDVWCSDALIENNILWGYDMDAALLLRNGVHAMIRGNQFIGGANGSIYLLSTNTHSCDDASIIDNYFDGSGYSINGNWAIKALTKMVNCRIIGNNFWRQKKGAIYGNLQSCLIQNNCFVDNDAKNEGIPDIWLPMENDVFSNTISGNLFRRDSCFDTSGNWIARTVATKPYIFRFYNNANHAPTLVSGNVNGTQSAYDTIFVEGSASTAVLSDNVGMPVTGGVLTETDFTSAYKTKVDSLWNDYQSAMTALGI